jgi:hypothetical protein
MKTSLQQGQMKAIRYIPVDAVTKKSSLCARHVAALLTETGNNDASSGINSKFSIVCCNLPQLVTCKESWSQIALGKVVKKSIISEKIIMI